MAGRPRRCLVCLALLAGLGGAACVPDFPPASELGDEPQVLAVRATPPEAAPGEAIRLDALIHWPESTPGLAWLVCIPGPLDDLDTCVSSRFTTLDAVARCEDEPEAALCLAGRDATALYRVPDRLLPADQEELTLYVELVATSLPAGPAACDEAVRDIYPTTDCALSLKRLAVSERPEPNRNPVLLPLLVNGESLDATAPHVLDLGGVDPGDFKVDLGVSVEPESVDELGMGDPPPDEARLPVLWYTTCGSLGDDAGSVRCARDGECVAHETGWSPKTSGDCTVHVVVRDGRGGVDWLTREFVIQ